MKKICLLGEFSGKLDEAARKISFHIANELSHRNELLTLDLRDVFHRKFWLSMKKFNPEIIHYIHGGSPKGFLLLGIISRFCPKAKKIISIMRLSPLSMRLLSIYQPDLILAQSFDVAERLKKIGCHVEFMPIGGVDMERFTPACPETVNRLRNKYGISSNKFIILHVGSIKVGRNILFLKNFQNDKDQVVIVGSTSTGFNLKIVQQLRDSGCLVFLKYFQNIEEIYALSDCYIFPVLPEKKRSKATCIDFPLSVLEAMSCNLPVITTKFGGLPEIFDEGEGLFFAETEKDFIEVLNEIKKGLKVKTREKVKPHSWANVVKKLEAVYYKLISNENEK